MGYVGEHLRECRLHEEKHFLRSRINYHPVRQILVRSLQYLIVTVSLTNNNTTGAVTLHRGNSSAAKVNPHIAAELKLDK